MTTNGALFQYVSSSFNPDLNYAILHFILLCVQSEPTIPRTIRFIRQDEICSASPNVSDAKCNVPTISQQDASRSLVSSLNRQNPSAAGRSLCVCPVYPSVNQT